MGTFDFYKGFWQLPLDTSSQEYFSFVTEDGVFTPRRVPQGASDSAVHFQSQMHRIFEDMIYHTLLIWVDDVLLFARCVEDYLQVLRDFFQRLRVHRLKLHPRKCNLFRKQIIWCGRVIDGEGITHDPERLRALKFFGLPPMGLHCSNFYVP